MVPFIDVTVMAAEDLKDVALFGKMDVYAVLWIDPTMKRTTRILRKGGKNPVWNEFLSIPVGSHRHDPNAKLTVQVFSDSSISDRKLVGSLELAMREIIMMSPWEGDDPFPVDLPLKRPSGRIQGIVSLSMRLGAEPQPPRPVITSAPPSVHINRTAAIDKDDLEPVLGIPVAPFPGPGYGTGPGYGNGFWTPSTGYPSLPSIQSRDAYAPSGSELVPYAYPPDGYQGYSSSYPGYGMDNQNSYPYPYVQPVRSQPVRRYGGLLLGLLGGAISGFLLGDIAS